MTSLETAICAETFFSFLPKYDVIIFKGIMADKVQHFEARQGEEKKVILGVSMVCKDQKFVWESFRDMLQRSVQGASAMARGVYQFSLLHFDAHREIKTFNCQELTQLLVNTARGLDVGQEKFIKYSSCFGLLKKISEADWGKITFKTAVEVFNKKPEQLDLFIKKVLTSGLSLSVPLIVIIHDLGQQPVFDANNKEQQQRLRKTLEKVCVSFKQRPDIYMKDKDRVFALKV